LPNFFEKADEEIIGLFRVEEGFSCPASNMSLTEKDAIRVY
jgi:hypothetical protein